MSRMDANTRCEAAGCGDEMTDLVPDPFERSESVSLLAKAPMIRVCDEHARIIGNLYAETLTLALVKQKDPVMDTQELQVLADQLRGIKTDKAQATYALLGHYFRGIE